MAVIDELPGLEISVYVNGSKAIKYEDEDEGEDDFQLPTGTMPVDRRGLSLKFSIKPYEKFGCAGLEFHTRVDGVEIDRMGVLEPEYHRAQGWNDELKGRHERNMIFGTEPIRPFKFSRIETTTDQAELRNLEKDKKRAKDTGEIVVGIYRLCEIRNYELPRNFQDEHTTSLTHEVKIHERALKGEAKSHATLYGEEQISKFSNTEAYDGEFLDGDDFPFGLFRFRYRSKEALKQLLVLERTPEPEHVTPAQELSFLDALAPKERREAEKYIQKLQKTQSSPVKHEREESEHDDIRPRKRVRKQKEKVYIDLTLD